jgi:hypothetical protein
MTGAVFEILLRSEYPACQDLIGNLRGVERYLSAQNLWFRPLTRTVSTIYRA